MGTSMWKFCLLLFFSSHLARANIVDDLLLTDEAIQLLQIDKVHTLEKNLQLAEHSLRKSEQEVQTTKAELENTKRHHATQIQEMKSGHENTKRDHATQIQQMRSRYAEEVENQERTLQAEVEKSWTLVSFMMKVLKMVQGAAKAREELVVTQAAMLNQLKAEVDECKENIGDSLKMVSDSKEVIQGQQKTIEDLKNVVVEESSLNAAYLELKEANCDIPSYLEALPKAMTAQQEEIELLKQAVSGEDTVADLLATIGNAAVRGAEVVRADEQNWGVLEQCQDVLQKQSSSLDLLKTIASERVTRNNSLRFTEDDEGHIVAAGFCQCIPDPPEHSTEVSLSLARGEDGWLPTWSAWQNDPITLKATRRKLSDLDAEHWEEDVEESSLPLQCFEHNVLNSPTRRSTYNASTDHCDKDNARDWAGAGWYRVTGEAGTKLSESPVSQNRCGTEAPGWLTGGHPTVFEGEVTRTAKFSLGSSYNATTNVKVINCDTHYVYYLEKVNTCQDGYCTE